MSYNVYKGDELIAEKINEQEYTAEGLTPNTEYSFSVSEIIGGKESEKATITVKTKQSDVASVAVAPKTNSVDVDKTKQLNSTVLPTTAPQAVTWKSDKGNIAKVSASGLVTAVAQGSATITATAGNKTDTATVTVTVPIIAVTGVSVTPEVLTLEVEETGDLTATVTPANATDKTIAFTTGDTDIASTSATGDTRTITGKAAGTTTVTARAGDNITAICNVTVVEPEPEPDPDPDPELGG